MIAVIGGAGFIGGYLCDYLRAQALPYKILDCVLSGDGFIDVTIPETFSSLEGCSVIINLAAVHADNVSPSSLYYKVNVDGAKNICDYCDRNGIRDLIFTSSVAVYGNSDSERGESSALQPDNDYGKSKRDAEAVYMRWFRSDSGKRRLAIVRPTAVLGVGSKGNIFNLCSAIANHKFLMVGKGSNKKSLVLVENVVALIGTLLASSERSILIVNAVDKPDFAVRELVDTVFQILHGKRRQQIHIPVFVAYVLAAFIEFFHPLGFALQISRARVKKFGGNTCFSSCADELGFAPVKDFKAGLKDYLIEEKFVASGSRTNRTERN